MTASRVLKVFYPIIHLTTIEYILSAIPAKRFLPHLTIPSIVIVLTEHEHTAEVQFPLVEGTDIVSLNYLHCVDSPEVTALVKSAKKGAAQ